MDKRIFVLSFLVLLGVGSVRAQQYDGETQRRWNEQRDREDFEAEQRQRWLDEDRRREEAPQEMSPELKELIPPSARPWLPR